MNESKITLLPDGQRIVPYLSVKDAPKAIDFYVRAFGAVETMRLVDPTGRVGHAELEVEGARFMLADEHPQIDSVGPQTLGGTSVSLSLYVADVDALSARAVAAGATLLRPVCDEFYGDRVAWMTDPFGHKWALTSRIEAVSNEEIARRYAEMIRA